MNIIPNLFIGGAQKSGTTSLHFLLKSHPDIFIPETPQEIHFFDIDETYAKGLDWYTNFFAAWKNEPIIGQTSPLYLFEPTVPVRIKEVAPQAKFIFILRNPIDRAYSHYWHSVRRGYESLSFEEAIEKERDRIGKGAKFRRRYSYLSRGEYSKQIANFLRFFPRENILILLFDELKESYTNISHNCGHFLNIDPNKFIYNNSSSQIHNQAKIPRIKLLAKWVSNQYNLHHLSHGEKPLSLIARLNKNLNLKTVKYPEINQTTRLQLIEYFTSEIEKLEKITHLDLQHWLK